MLNNNNNNNNISIRINNYGLCGGGGGGGSRGGVGGGLGTSETVTNLRSLSIHYLICPKQADHSKLSRPR